MADSDAGWIKLPRCAVHHHKTDDGAFIFVEYGGIIAFESCPRWLLVDWHTPPNVCISPLLENEEFLTLAVEDPRGGEHAARVA